jgi:uncharacterized protein (TIGR02099 family)
LYVAGLKISGQSEDDKLSDWLLKQSHIIVHNGRVTWLDEMRDKPALIFDRAQFKLDNSRRHHRFLIKVSPPPTLATPLEMSGDLIGRSFADWKNWRGELQAQVNYADVNAWREWVTLPETLTQAKGEIKAVIGVEEGQLKRISVDLKLREVQSRLAADLPPIVLTSLQGGVGWQKLDRGFEVSTRNLSLKMDDGVNLPATDLLLRLSGEVPSRFDEGALSVNAIALDKLPLIAKYLPIEEKYRKKWDDFFPRGQIKALHAQWVSEANQNVHFEVRTGFENLSFRRVGDLPGMTGLTGEISGSDNSGQLTLDSRDLSLDAPGILLGPVTFNTFKMQASWQRKLSDWDFKFNNLSLVNEDLAGSAYGHYQFRPDSLGSADITLNLNRALVPKVVNYLPKKLLGDAVMTWLQKGLLAGNAEEVIFRLRGDLKDFPFTGNKAGIFQVKAKAKGLGVNYASGWPRVENAAATLLIEGPRLQIEATTAKLAGASTERVSIGIADMMSKEPILKVSGEARGETRHALNFIKHSPVRDYIKGFTDVATARGEGKFSLQLDIPFSNTPNNIRVRYEFFDNEIVLNDTIPQAQKVSGELSFTEASLQIKNISAQMLGGPASLSVQTDKNGVMNIKLKGDANMDVWRKANNHPLLQNLHGSAHWTAEANLLKDFFSLSVNSNLQGLASVLPAPLNKNISEAIPLKFELTSDRPSQDELQLQYGNVLNLRLVREDDVKGSRTIKRGQINLGALNRAPEKEGFWISGTLPLFSIDSWREVLKQAPASQGALPELEGADLTIQKLVGFESTINALSVHARNHNGVLTTQVSSKEMNGEISWFPQGKGKLVARLKNAALVDRDGQKESNAPVKKPAKAVNKATVPISIPTLDIAIDQFTYRGNPLGRLEIHASQFEKDILLNSMRLTNPDGVLQMNGKWSAAPAQTHLAAKLTLSDLGKVLGRSGYPNRVKNGSGTLDCDMVWNGSPEQFTPANLDGYLNLTMSKGEFSKLDTVAGKGFEFKNITGIAKIRQGVLSTDNLIINGTLANVGLVGQVDLGRETQNLRASVSPNISNGVSLLAFAGGPAVGAIVFIANKLLRDPLDKLASFEYNVTGTWADPKIDKVGQVQTSPR